jgi:hypothetical protein
MPPTASQNATFEDDCQQAVDQLRAALVQLYDNINADPLSPQDVARRFKLNKTFTWNVSRLIQAQDGLAALAHVPGKAAIEKMLEATQRDGANKTTIQSVRSAADAFERVVEIHLGDRTTLDLVLDSMAAGDSDALERSRKLAFRGNSGLYGVQARTRLMCCFMFPSVDDPSRLDMAMISGYCAFRRFRSSARWPILKMRTWSDADEPIASQTWLPLDQSTGNDPANAILHRFNRGSVPDLELTQSDEGVDLMLLPGPIGNPGAFDCYRGDYLRSAACRYKMDGDDFGEFGATITSPSEHLVFDLIVHRDLTFALDPDVVIYGSIAPQGRSSEELSDSLRLPIKPTIADLSGHPPAVATSLVPGYADIVRFVYEQMQWNPSDATGVRLHMKYPPLGSNVLMRFGLPDPP